MSISRRTRRPSSPGEILAELYLGPNEISIAAFAAACGVTRLNLQNAVDLYDAERRLAESNQRPQLMPAFAQAS